MISANKYLKVQDGIILLFDLPGIIPPLPEPPALHLSVDGEELLLTVHDAFTVPVKCLMLDQISSSSINLYLAGSLPQEMKIDTFCIIILDEKMMGKIQAYEEMLSAGKKKT